MKPSHIFVALLACILAFTCVYADAPQTTLTVTNTSLFDAFWSQLTGSTFSVSNGPGTLPARAAGEYYDLKYVWSCHSAGDAQRFSVDYREYANTQSRVGLQTTYYTVQQSCAVGDWKYTTLSNLKVPNLPSPTTNQYEIIVQHQILSNGVWTTDTGGKANIDGYTDIALFQFQPAVNKCLGLTGTAKGDKYCDGNNVAQQFYNQYVVNGVCQTQQNILQNCISPQSCIVGKCVAPVAMPVNPVTPVVNTSSDSCIIMNAGPTVTVWELNTTQANGQCSSHTTCQLNANKAAYAQSETACESNFAYLYQNATTQPTQTPSPSLFATWWQAIVTWFLSLFSR